MRRVGESESLADDTHFPTLDTDWADYSSFISFGTAFYGFGCFGNLDALRPDISRHWLSHISFLFFGWDKRGFDVFGQSR